MKIPTSGVYCYSLSSEVCTVPNDNGNGMQAAIEAHSNFNSERTWLLANFTDELHAAGRLFAAGKKCSCNGKPAMAAPPRRRSTWNMFMKCHQALYANLERSGFRQIQERYNNLTDQEKLEWSTRLGAGEQLQLTDKEKADWWLLHDELPPTTRKRAGSKRQRATRPCPSSTKLSVTAPPAPPAGGAAELKRQRAADQRFRRKVSELSRDKLENAAGLKSDVDLLRIFADINKAGYNDEGARQRQRRANRALGSFIRLRYHERHYDYLCRGCRRVREKARCNCEEFTDAPDEPPTHQEEEEPTKMTSAAAAATVLSQPRPCAAGFGSELGICDWEDGEEVTSAFMVYLQPESRN